MDRRRRTCLAALVIVSLTPIALLQDVLGQNSTPRIIQVNIENRKVVKPEKAIRITENEVVILRWSSDERVKLHLHGYDQELQLRPGKVSSMPVTGRATGRFPITSHGWGQDHGHHALTYLEVHPR